MDDLISRQAAIESIAELQARAASKTELTVISKAWKRLKAIPSAEVEPVKRGKWILKSEAPITREKYWECSLCGCGSDSFDTVYFTPYCPYCGAKMFPETEEGEDAERGSFFKIDMLL